MKLQEYLDEEDISAAKLARRCKMSSVKMYQILNEEHDMLLSIALRIQKETKGKVKPTDLLTEEFWKENRRAKGKSLKILNKKPRVV